MVVGLSYAIRNIIILHCAAVVFIICDKIQSNRLPRHDAPSNDPNYHRSGVFFLLKNLGKNWIMGARNLLGSPQSCCKWVCGALIVLLTVGIFSAYYICADFNERLNKAEDMHFEALSKLGFLESKLSNCYPND